MGKNKTDKSFTLLTEEMLRKAVLEVLKENRKVLRVGGSQSSAPSMTPSPDPNMGQPMQDSNMGVTPDIGLGDMNAQDTNMGGMPDDGAEQNQFDTNFDAGVEADEETDPKHYIQQLTGKLSQSLNSYNEENGPDAGICKYVASMIIAAAAKNLDEKAKKELIEKINSASSDEEEPADSDMEDSMGEEMPDDGMGDVPQNNEQQPMMESFITKRQLAELAFGTTKEREKISPNIKQKKKSIFGGKSF